jgi:phosphoribosylformylglycinamidine synthase
MDAVQRFAADGGIVLGICNGFQVLCEAGMLPGALIRNESLKFLGQTVHVRVENADTAFSNAYQTGQVLEMHIAHGDGNYVADEDTLDMLESTGRVVFRYVTGNGLVTAAANPNGSMRSIAGIINEGGNVLGLMPHPERSVEALLGSADGLGVFASLDAHLSGEAVQATAGER